MNVLAAAALLPLERRLDWSRPHLSYMPRGAYEARESWRTRLLRRFAEQFRRFGRRLI
jgi:hypothetical protein